MKDKFPYFPHSSTTTEKKWDKELFDNKFIYQYIHPIAIEISIITPITDCWIGKKKESHFLIDIVNLYRKATEVVNNNIGSK